MTNLSVNINKIATLRNARGGDRPNVIQFALDCERFGANGITIHPRPDERHITRADAVKLSQVILTELNIEGFPDERFMKIIKDIQPQQATLVPDPPGVLTSNAGWDVIKNKLFLQKIIAQLQDLGVRTSLFLGTEIHQLEMVKEIGADRIELYTGPFAENYTKNKELAVNDFILTAQKAYELALGVNAGHDLSLDNLSYLIHKIPFIDEVSIGHALISDSLYLGLENTIQRYLLEIEKGLLNY